MFKATRLVSRKWGRLSFPIDIRQIAGPCCSHPSPYSGFWNSLLCLPLAPKATRWLCLGNEPAQEEEGRGQRRASSILRPPLRLSPERVSSALAVSLESALFLREDFWKYLFGKSLNYPKHVLVQSGRFCPTLGRAQSRRGGGEHVRSGRDDHWNFEEKRNMQSKASELVTCPRNKHATSCQHLVPSTLSRKLLFIEHLLWSRPRMSRLQRNLS